MRVRVLIWCLQMLLAGCIASNTPSDLTFLSVQVVDWRDQAELPGPGASPLIGMVSNRDLLAMGESLTGGEKSHRPLLKVWFTSAMDLQKIATERSANIRNKTFFCDRPKTSPIMAFPDVYWRGIRLGEREPDPIEQQNGAPITYYIFVDVAKPTIVPSPPPQEGYDLRQKPEDVCFGVGGGNEWGFGHKSNMVRIPKEAIAAALRDGAPNTPR